MTEVLAAVLEKEPDWSALPATLPENVKSPAAAVPDQGSAAVGCATSVTRVSSWRRRSRGRWPPTAGPGGATACLLAGRRGGLACWRPRRTRDLGLAPGARGVPAPEVVRFTHQFPPGHRMAPGLEPQRRCSRRTGSPWRSTTRWMGSRRPSSGRSTRLGTEAAGRREEPRARPSSRLTAAGSPWSIGWTWRSRRSPSTAAPRCR